MGRSPIKRNVFFLALPELSPPIFWATCTTFLDVKNNFFAYDRKIPIMIVMVSMIIMMIIMALNDIQILRVFD